MNPEDKAQEWEWRKKGPNGLIAKANYLQMKIADANEQWVRKGGKRIFADARIYSDMLDVIGEIENLTGKPWAEALGED